MLKKLVITFIAVVLFIPSVSSAAILPFGGKVTASIPCTCPPFGLLIYLTPLYIRSSIPITGTIYYSPLSAMRTYKNFLVGVPSTWELGTLIPGGMCMVINPVPPPAPPCLPIFALGTVQSVGTSLPGL